MRLKQLEEENGKLKRIVADLALDKEMLQDVIKRGGAIPQEHVKELEAPDVATQDNQAKRQRRRQDKTDRSPDPAPRKWRR